MKWLHRFGQPQSTTISEKCPMHKCNSQMDVEFIKRKWFPPCELSWGSIFEKFNWPSRQCNRLVHLRNGQRCVALGTFWDPALSHWHTDGSTATTAFRVSTALSCTSSVTGVLVIHFSLIQCRLRVVWVQKTKKPKTVFTQEASMNSGKEKGPASATT